MTIHYNHGFSLATDPQDGAFPKTIVQFPYEKLKMSSDDGIRMLYLDFGGKDGEIVSYPELWVWTNILSMFKYFSYKVKTT